MSKSVGLGRAFIGTAGWSIPRIYAASFPKLGSHLERYAAVFSATEINTSFYRPHRKSTYERWGASVPDHFRFSVKAPIRAARVGRGNQLIEIGAIAERDDRTRRLINRWRLRL